MPDHKKLINLGDYLGTLISEITIARMQSDLESLRISELYRKHEYLKHFAIPHFRIPNITLKVPVAIADVDEIKEDNAPRGKIRRKEYSNEIKSVVSSELKGIVSENNIKRISEELEEEFTQLSRGKLQITPFSISKSLSNSLSDKLKSIEKEATIDKKKLKEITDRTLNQLRVSAINNTQDPPRIKIFATTNEIKEVPQDTLIHLELNISEEGFEWKVGMGHEGELDEKLVPE